MKKIKIDKLTREEKLKLMDWLLRNSKLTEEDAIEIGRKIKEGLAKKHGIM